MNLLWLLATATCHLVTQFGLQDNHLLLPTGPSLHGPELSHVDTELFFYFTHQKPFIVYVYVCLLLRVLTLDSGLSVVHKKTIP